MTEKITADLVIQKYVETRDKIAEIEKECKARVADLKAMQDKREMWLSGSLDDAKETGKNTPHGSCHFYYLDSATCADGAAFKEWVIVNQEWDFFTNSVSKEAVKNWVDEGKAVPPGVNYSKIRKIKIVRPNNTAKS